MTVEDLTKALYFLNITDYKNLVNITKIEKGIYIQIGKTKS